MWVAVANANGNGHSHGNGNGYCYRAAEVFADAKAASYATSTPISSSA